MNWKSGSLVVGLTIFALAACGDSGSTAIIKLMDAPPQGVTAVKVFVANVDIHVVDPGVGRDADPNDTSIDNDNKWKSLEINDEIDLVAHQGEGAAALLGELSLPEGKITQIRLMLDVSKPQTVTQDNADCNMDTSEVPPTGIKINHPFKAFDSKDGLDNEILLDFELADSLTASGDCFRLKPVIKLVKVRTDGEDVQL